MKAPSSASFPTHGEFTVNYLQVQLMHVGLIDSLFLYQRQFSWEINNCLHLQLLIHAGGNPAVALQLHPQIIPVLKIRITKSHVFRNRLLRISLSH